MGNYIVGREAIDIEYHAPKLRYQMPMLKLICTSACNHKDNINRACYRKDHREGESVWVMN